MHRLGTMSSVSVSIAILGLVLAACAERRTLAPRSPDPPHHPTDFDASTPTAALSRLEDSSNRLTRDEKAKLTAQLHALTSTTGSNVGVLVAPSLNGGGIDSSAKTTFSEWHLGERGILVVLAMEEHRSRIETGPGVEGVLTDDLCGRILREKLRPHLQQDEVYEALHEGLEAIGSILQDRRDAGTKPQRIGRTYSNGNCALDSNHKLTGLCEGSDGTGKACVEHAPDPDSPPCKVGLISSETRVAPCSTSGSPVVVSREHQCFWLHE